MEISLPDFWKWSSSDLLSNATRGIFAEYIVSLALGASMDGGRKEWDAFDVLTPEGLKIEVKSAAYVQSWKQKSHSKILFGIGPTKGWDAETNVYDTEIRRQADVYVFALLTCKDRETADPMNLENWEFYVLPTSVLNERLPFQKTLSLSRLASLAEKPVGVFALRDTVTALQGR
jgi:hypothetical protein